MQPLLFKNREKNTALSEMFSIELKFTVERLKSWFNRYHKVLEVKRLDIIIFMRVNPNKENTICCLCDFPLNSRAENEWSQHVFKAEYLFLANIFIYVSYGN